MNGVGEATEYMECSFALPSFLSVGSPFHSMSSPNELEKNCCEAFETKDGMFSFSRIQLFNGFVPSQMLAHHQ